MIQPQIDTGTCLFAGIIVSRSRMHGWMLCSNVPSCASVVYICCRTAMINNIVLYGHCQDPQLCHVRTFISVLLGFDFYISRDQVKDLSADLRRAHSIIVVVDGWDSCRDLTFMVPYRRIQFLLLATQYIAQNSTMRQSVRVAPCSWSLL